MKIMTIKLKDIVCVEDDADEEQIELAILDRIEAITRAIREGGMDLSDEDIDVSQPKEIHPVCPRCGKPVIPSGLGPYAFACEGCDEDFFRYECKEE